MLSHEDLINALDESDISKRLVTTRLLDRAAQVGPGSIDHRLGTELLIPSYTSRRRLTLTQNPPRSHS